MAAPLFPVIRRNALAGKAPEAVFVHRNAVVFLEFGGKVLHPAVSDRFADLLVGQLVFPDQAGGMFHAHILQIIHQLSACFLMEYPAQVPGADAQGVRDGLGGKLRGRGVADIQNGTTLRLLSLFSLDR